MSETFSYEGLVFVDANGRVAIGTPFSDEAKEFLAWAEGITGLRPAGYLRATITMRMPPERIHMYNPEIDPPPPVEDLTTEERVYMVETGQLPPSFATAQELGLVPEDDEQIVMGTCPKCGAEQRDYDGLGVLYCPKCGYCDHASATGDGERMFCDFCGKDVSDGFDANITDPNEGLPRYA